MNCSYTVALYVPCETVLDSQGNKLSSITVVGYYLPIMERMKVNAPPRKRKNLHGRFDVVNTGLFITYPAPLSGSCYYLPIMERMKVDMTGRWKKDAKYGLQFMMESYEDRMPRSFCNRTACPALISIGANRVIIRRALRVSI